VIEKETEAAKGKAYKGFKLYADYKELLARKDIDAIIIATPDHWHVIQTIEACRAGKDVYVEKPMSHSLAEGRAMADAVAKYNRVLQVGNMQRSWPNFRHACELVRNGYIGEIREIKVAVGVPPVKYNLPAQPVPKSLDWEQWIGPAPMNPFNDELIFMERGGFPNWRDYREYGGGMVADWGAHMFDIAQWAMGMDDSGPVEYFPPDVKKRIPLTMRYANGTVMTHEYNIRKTDSNSVRFIGEDGVIDISRSFLDTIPSKLQDQVIGDNEIRLYHSDDHYADFLNSIKTRKQPLSTVEVGHRTASVCHIANLCYELDRPLTWNPEKETFFADAEANRRRSNPLRAPYTLDV
jgi:predicted dehydrogenase